MSEEYSGGDYVPVRGMSLRDWYAGQALVRMVGAMAAGDAIIPPDEFTADIAFRIADAMMAERKKRHKSGNIEVNGIWYMVDADLEMEVASKRMASYVALDEHRRRHG